MDGYLNRIAAGDPAAVGQCIDRYGPLVLAQARRFGLAESQAEDAVQEIFIELWKSAERFDAARSSERTFVTMVARRRLIDLRRRGSRGPRTTPLDDLDVGDADAGLASVEDADEAAVASRALAQLRPDEQRVIRLSVITGLTHREIADTTGIPLGTVKSHLRRGLERVRDLLGAFNLGSTPEVTS